MPRIRSMAMSIWAGRNTGTDGGWGPFWNVFSKLGGFIDPGSSMTYVLLDERQDSINDASFVVVMDNPLLAGTMQLGIHGNTAAPAVVRCALAPDPERASSLDGRLPSGVRPAACAVPMTICIVPA